MKYILITLALTVSLSSFAGSKKKEEKKNWSSDLRTKMGSSYKGFTRI